MTAPETTKPTEKSESRTEERRSYVIRDEDDSDDDDLIDVDEESERKGKLQVKGPIVDSEVTIHADTTNATQKGAEASQKPDEKATISPK